eukprot:6202390-Pleurochrysis_carterae.AAC.2
MPANRARRISKARHQSRHARTEYAEEEGDPRDERDAAAPPTRAGGARRRRLHVRALLRPRAAQVARIARAAAAEHLRVEVEAAPRGGAIVAQLVQRRVGEHKPLLGARGAARHDQRAVHNLLLHVGRHRAIAMSPVAAMATTISPVAIPPIAVPPIAVPPIAVPPIAEPLIAELLIVVRIPAVTIRFITIPAITVAPSEALPVNLPSSVTVASQVLLGI